MGTGDLGGRTERIIIINPASLNTYIYDMEICRGKSQCVGKQYLLEMVHELILCFFLGEWVADFPFLCVNTLPTTDNLQPHAIPMK